MAHEHEHEHGVEPMAVDGSFVPCRAADLVSREIDGELLLLDPRTDGLHHLDRLGTVIWKILDGEAPVDELVDDLAEAFGAPRDVVRADFSELLVGLRHSFLLEGDDPPDQLLVGARGGDAADIDGIWRPDYLVDPPAP